MKHLFIGLLFLLMTSQVESFAQVPKPSSGQIVRIENFNSVYVPARNVDVWLPEHYNPQKSMLCFICTMDKCCLIPQQPGIIRSGV